MILISLNYIEMQWSSRLIRFGKVVYAEAEKFGIRMEMEVKP